MMTSLNEKLKQLREKKQKLLQHHGYMKQTKSYNLKSHSSLDRKRELENLPDVQGTYTMPSYPVIGTGVDVSGVKSKFKDHATFHLRVHPNGKSPDGLTWETAYPTIQAAYAAASSSENDLTHIIMAPGTYDLDIAGGFELAKNIGIVGIYDRATIIKNDHASATHVFNLTNKAELNLLTIDCDTTNDKDGIWVTGNKSCLTNVRVDASGTTTTVNCIYVKTGVSNLCMDGCTLGGNNSNTVGLLLEGNGFHEINNTIGFQLGTGLKINASSEQYTPFEHFILNTCDTGVSIVSGADYNAFTHFYFYNNNTNVIDNAVSTVQWRTIYPDKIILQTTPTTPGSGITTTAGATANTWGDYVTIVDNISSFFRIKTIFVANNSDTGNLIINLAKGSAGSESSIVTLPINSGSKRIGGSNQIESSWIPANTRISARIISDSDGGDTIDVWIIYYEINY